MFTSSKEPTPNDTRISPVTIHSFTTVNSNFLRTLFSQNAKNIKNPLIFLRKMAAFSGFGRHKVHFFLTGKLDEKNVLLTLVSYNGQIMKKDIFILNSNVKYNHFKPLSQ